MSNPKKPAVVGVRVIQDRSSSRPVEKSLSPEQITREDAINAGDWITPTMDLRGLKVMASQSTILPQCTRAYRNNIPGFGIGVRYKEDVEETPEMAAEFTKMEELIELLNLDQDTKEVFEDVIEARETYGISYLEVIRNIGGEVSQIEFVRDTPSMQKTKPLEPYQKVQFLYKGRIEERQKKYMKYRQQSNGRTVYFKEFGDKRIMDKRTGEYVKKLPIEYQANEIIEFPIGTAPYGEVRWIGQILSVDGARKAEYLNNNYFENGRHTPLLIMLQGGTLSDDSYEKLQRYMDDIKGVNGQHGFIILETEAADNTAGFEESKSSIEVKDLASILQTDELFQNYLDNSRRKMQSAFLLPDLYVGYTTDFNRATAQTAMEVTEKQVFQPERKNLEWTINNKLLGEYGFQHVEAYFLEPDMSNPDDLAKILSICNNAGGLTPNKARQIALEALGEVSEDYPEEWGDVPIALQKNQQSAPAASLGTQMNTAIQKAQANHDDDIVPVLKEVRNLLKKLEKPFTNSSEHDIMKWNEDDHPRDDAGKFSDSGGGSGSGTDSGAGGAKSASDELNDRIASGAISTTLDSVKQNKHIEGTKEYQKAIKVGKHPSKLTIGADEQQQLIDRYTKEGTARTWPDGSIRVSFTHNSTIGTCFSADGKSEVETSSGKIHYSKSGAHIVPDWPKGV